MAPLKAPHSAVSPGRSDFAKTLEERVERFVLGQVDLGLGEAILRIDGAADALEKREGGVRVPSQDSSVKETEGGQHFRHDLTSRKAAGFDSTRPDVRALVEWRPRVDGRTPRDAPPSAV